MKDLNKTSLALTSKFLEMRANAFILRPAFLHIFPMCTEKDNLVSIVIPNSLTDKQDCNSMSLLIGNLYAVLDSSRTISLN